MYCTFPGFQQKIYNYQDPHLPRITDPPGPIDGHRPAILSAPCAPCFGSSLSLSPSLALTVVPGPPRLDWGLVSLLPQTCQCTSPRTVPAVPAAHVGPQRLTPHPPSLSPTLITPRLLAAGLLLACCFAGYGLQSPTRPGPKTSPRSDSPTPRLWTLVTSVG